MLLAVDAAIDLQRQIASAARTLTTAPVVVVTASEEPDLLEKAVAARAADIVHVPTRTLPQNAYESVSFAIRKAMLVSQAPRRGRALCAGGS